MLKLKKEKPLQKKLDYFDCERMALNLHLIIIVIVKRAIKLSFKILMSFEEKSHVSF